MVDDDVILEQVEFTYDSAGNVIQTVTRRRYHDAPDSQTGPLEDPSTTPKARVTYVASYPDPLGRVIATAEYGTNGGTALSRPGTVPARSDNVLVTTTSFNSAGRVASTTNAAGVSTCLEYDAAGRQTKVVMNCVSGSSSSSSSSSSGGCPESDDVNVTVLTAYNGDGNVSSLTAINGVTGNQTTQFVYGTTLADSDIASSLLKVAEIYPDSVDDDDRITFQYNRQRQVKQVTDQNGTVHAFDFDKLGRMTQDRVTTLGTGVDGAIRRIASNYEVRGMRTKLTNWNGETVGSGSVVNDVQFTYNDFAQLLADYQAHGGSVSTSTTPKVQYGYASGSANTIRPTSLTYPNGRVISYDYGTAGGIPDAVSRIDAIKDGGTALAQYSYLGLGTFVITDYTEPDIKWILADLSGTNDPDTGDIYSGFDRFGRVKDNRWYNYGGSADTDRIKYGYDRAGNRIWRQNTVATSMGKAFDEFYWYDGIHRLKDMQRGTLNAGKTAITGGTSTFAECWGLDTTGNWSNYRQDDNGDGSWDLIQNRANNTVNEITNLTETAGPSWITPAYDAAGNMTTIPKPANPTQSYAGIYDAWNRLTAIKEGGDFVAEYAYDPAKRRTIQKSYTSGVLSETRHYFCTSQWQVVEERVGASSSAERQFVWGLRYIDDLVLRDRDTDGNGSLDERLYAMQDANWNMTVLVTTSSVAQERYVYSPFGSVTLFDGTWNTIHGPFVIDNRVLFTGQQLDTVTSLYFFRLRYYCPLLGAFIARDSLTYPNGPNTYLAWFVPNNLDPSGMITVNYQYQLPGKNDPNPVPCDEAYVVEWDFVLNNTPSANGCVPYTTKNGTTIGGYIVQEVQLTCKEAPCEYINCVPKKCNLANAPAQTTTFYEAWEVPMNGTTATDQATYNPRKNKCYDLTATGTIKFICAHTSGDLRSQWGTAPLPSPCGQVNHAGIGTGSRPLWWNNSNLPEKPGSRSAHFTSQCCGGKSDFVNATYVPGA